MIELPTGVVMVMCLVACGKTDATRPPGATSQPSMRAIAAPSATSYGAPDASSAAPLEGCTVQSSETLDDHEGTPSAEGTQSVENVRIVANPAGTIVTWERQANYQIGDTWRAPVVAMRSNEGKFAATTFPVMSYAAASYGRIAPLGGTERFVTWGVRNMRGMELWKGVPKMSIRETGTEILTPPARSIATPNHQVRGLVASHGVAVVWASASSCFLNCESFGPPWLGVFSLTDPKAKPIKLLQPSKDGEDPVPALAMTESAGIVVYREKKALYRVWLDAKGAPTGPAVVVAEGEVGAPAVAMTNHGAVVMWAQRGDKSLPYALHWQRIERADVDKPSTLHTVTGTGSAFAPSLLVDEGRAWATWMEGDGGTKGEIRMASLPLEVSSPEHAVASIVVSTSEETNARDPEIAGSITAPQVVYAAFSKSRPGGVVRLATLHCGAKP